MRLLHKAALLVIVLAFARAQAYPPCAAGTSFLAVASTQNAVTLASSLRCSNGTFDVKWFGEVVVTETISVSQGTSLNITGSEPGATADGNHATRIFSVDGGSALHVTDMVLENGHGLSGGAVSATEHSSVTLSGNVTFAANTASRGGAIYADSSTVRWYGDNTAFPNNNASDSGGAAVTDGSSSTLWEGVTVFVDNSADISGGSVYVTGSSNVHWSGRTVFEDNAAWDGGALTVVGSSAISWDGLTTFTNNSAYDRGGAVLANDSSKVSWSARTNFTGNAAQRGGAMYAESSTVVWDSHDTTFRNNYASHYGGAVMANSSAAVSWVGETSFVDNTGAIWGGGLYVFDHSNVSWTGNTTFLNNSAQDGGGLFMREFCVGNWSGTTKFAGNTAVVTGGGLNVHSSSTASWTGATEFAGNTADRAGAIWIWSSAVHWNGITTFADNLARTDGGAMYATLTHTIIGLGTTMFQNNSAVAGNGGALGLYGSLSTGGSRVSFAGDTTFTNNSASGNGGAIFSSANPNGQHFEDVTFLSNSARVGGAVATFGTGNNDECTPVPTIFLRCKFFSNSATETGGAVETAFGQEYINSSHFENNSADVGGALRLAGNTTIRDCSFVSNLASKSGPAVGAVGKTDLSDSSFLGNTFSCRERDYLEEIQTEDPRTTRYFTVCDGCRLWETCHNCTVSKSDFIPKCSAALEHTTSVEEGSTLSTLSVNKGYWRATADSDTILPCYNEVACRGGKTGAETFCDDGYMGPYCSVCESGYSPSLTYTCTRCSDSRRQSLVVVASIATALAVCALGALSAYLLSTNVGERGVICLHRGMFRSVPLQAFKNIVVVWQILIQFASVANVTYPGVYQTFLNGIDIINLDIGFVMSAGCLWPGIDFHDRLLASTIWPLAVLGLLAVTYTVAIRRKSASCEILREKIQNKHLSVMLLLLFLVYSSVSSTVFKMFACDSVDGGNSYLRADYRIMCTDEKHQALQVYAAIMIVVYPIGIPLLYAVLLYRHRILLSEYGANKTKAQPIADLWAPYRPNIFYYEVIECGRRILLTGVAVFIYPNDTAQISITIMNSLFFFVVSEVLSPFASSSDTWLARGGHVIILFSMYDALLLKLDVSSERSESQHAFAAGFVAGHVVLILAVVVEAIGLCYAAKQEGKVVEAHGPSKSFLRSRSMRSVVPEITDIEHPPLYQTDARS